MQLRYKISYEYDFPKNSVVIILQSPYFMEEFICPNIGNLPAVLSHAIGEFNATHKLKIEELQENEETSKAIQRQKSVRSESGKGYIKDNKGSSEA